MNSPHPAVIPNLHYKNDFWSSKSNKNDWSTFYNVQYYFSLSASKFTRNIRVKIASK